MTLFVPRGMRSEESPRDDHHLDRAVPCGTCKSPSGITGHAAQVKYARNWYDSQILVAANGNALAAPLPSGLPVSRLWRFNAGSAKTIFCPSCQLAYWTDRAPT